MDNKINISFVISIAIAIMFLLGTPILGPVKVHAAEGFSPYIDTGSLFMSYDLDPPFATANGYSAKHSVSGGPYGVYFSRIANETRFYPMALYFNIGSAPSVSVTDFDFANNGSFTYEYQGTVYNVYWYCYYSNIKEGSNIIYNGQSYTISYPSTIIGTKVNTDFLYNRDLCISLCKFFLFGEGNFDYEKPAEDIADSDLDIHGLDCVVLNDQQVSIDVAGSMKNSWDNFISGCYSLIFDNPKDYISKALDHTGTGYVKNYVPGVSLLWDSPPVVKQSEALTAENPVQYTIWIDGKTDIKYNSSVDQIKNFFSGTSVGSCAYSKLQIHDGSIVVSPYKTYYYNTNQGLNTILDFIENNTQFTRPTETDHWQNLSVSTTVSRIYIQAHQTDPETGDNRYGAITYVDLSGGIPTVYEGVTEGNIDDIPASDPDDGTSTDTSQPFTVSGNDLVYDEPVHQANIGETGGGGFIVPPNGFLSAGLALIQAILELIKMWFLLKLVPILTLGFTGHI